jgi:hypothetical protein
MESTPTVRRETRFRQTVFAASGLRTERVAQLAVQLMPLEFCCIVHFVSF